MKFLFKPFLILCLSFLCTPPSFAQSSTEVRTRDGRSFYADSIEIRGTTMVVRPRGLAPIEISMSDILCIGAACGGTAPNPGPGPAQQGSGRFAVHGSNTVGATLMPMLIAKFGETELSGAVEPRFGQKPEEQSISIKVNGDERAVIDLASHGSGTAFTGLLSGAAAIGMSSRGIKPEEARELQTRYNTDMLAPDSEHVIALDGLAVIVNQANPLKAAAFNLDTLSRIFAGEITDWSQLGGVSGPVKIHARDSKSGTFGTFEDLVLKPFKRTLVIGATRYESSEALTDAVEADAAAIGFIGLPYIRNNAPLLLGSECGISHGPTRYAVQTEVYPLARRLYLYTPGTPREPLARDLIRFAQSPAGQAVVREAGFIDQTVELEDAQMKASWLQTVLQSPDPRTPRKGHDAFVEAARITQRTSVAFRFTSGSSNLENKARQDVARLAAALRARSFGQKKWYLIGFADNRGNWNQNVRLAFDRARAVGEALSSQGVQVNNDQLITFSWMAPVGCNETEAGRALNRRVEFWLLDTPPGGQ